MPEPRPEYEYRTGDLVRLTDDPHKGHTAKLTDRCDMSPRNWHMVPQNATDRRLDGFWCRDEGRIELALRDNTPKGEEVIVTATGSKWFGWRGHIKHRFSNGMIDVDFGSGIVGTLHERYLQYTTPATEAKQPQPSRLVGVTGRKRAGKDTFAKRLVDQHGFIRMAFADNVRKVALAIDPLVAEVTYAGKYVTHARLSTMVDALGWEKAKEITEVRRILQRIGTEGIRSLDDGFWIRQVLDNLPDGPVVITDVRFPNEADAIKKAGGVVIRVNRPGLDESDQHTSESAMDGYLHDWSVANTGTVEALYVKVDELVASGFSPGS